MRRGHPAARLPALRHITALGLHSSRLSHCAGQCVGAAPDENEDEDEREGEREDEDEDEDGKRRETGRRK
jgi:hypothetical protein